MSVPCLQKKILIVRIRCIELKIKIQYERQRKIILSRSRNGGEGIIFSLEYQISQFKINKIMVKRTGRAKPMTAKAGVTKTKRR